MALLKCENMTLGYDGEALIKDLSFEVNPGDYLCIVGENGAGKSTLMRTLLGLQPPMSGKVELGEGLKHSELGWLPQQTPVQRDFPASVKEIVRSGCQNRGGFRAFYSKEDKQRADAAMERMDITHLANRCYRELSGGLYAAIGELNREGMAIVMISHDVNTALRYATHILHLGGAIFFGSKEDYMRSGGARRYLRRREGGHK